jgi:hypothetical protein
MGGMTKSFVHGNLAYLIGSTKPCAYFRGQSR